MPLEIPWLCRPCKESMTHLLLGSYSHIHSLTYLSPFFRFPRRSGSVNTRKFDAVVTGLALAPIAKDAANHSLMVVTDNKKFYSFVTEKDRLVEKQATVLARRSNAIKFMPMPSSVDSSPILVVGDKVGDVTAHSMNDIVGRKKFLLGHTASIITGLEVCGENNEFLLTADRDEKIRVSAWPHPYLVSSFCLGHTRFVSSLATVQAPVGSYKKGELFVSGGGDGTLRLWHAASGTLLHTLYLCPSSSASPLKYSVKVAANSHEEGMTMVTSQAESMSNLQTSDCSSAKAESDDGKAAIPDTAMGVVLNRLPPAIVPLDLTMINTSSGVFVAFFVEGEPAVRIASIIAEKNLKQIPTPSGQSSNYGDSLDQVRLEFVDAFPLEENQLPYSLQFSQLDGESHLVLGSLNTNEKSFSLQLLSFADNKIAFAGPSKMCPEIRQINETLKTVTASAFPEDTDFTKIFASPMTAFPQDYDKIYVAERGKNARYDPQLS